MPRRKYLTEDRFSEFLSNDFHHIEKTLVRLTEGLAFLRGQMYVVIGLVMGLAIGVLVTLLQ